MSVWLCIPSARPPKQANPVLQKWRAMGYKIALWLDDRSNLGALSPDGFICAEYRGYAFAVNELIRTCISADPDAEWFVIGGDDTLPDPNKRADEIARECSEHFCRYAPSTDLGLSVVPTYKCQVPGCVAAHIDNARAATLGVMQPTGDRYAGGQIDRICGSAWIGREFATRAYRGNGPLWPGYTHMFVDEELQEVAKKYGVLWQRPDLTQLHMQYCRESAAIDSPAKEAKPPDHITHDGYTSEHWEKYQKIFNERKADGFPGSELL